MFKFSKKNFAVYLIAIFSSILLFSVSIYAIKVVMVAAPQKVGMKDDIFTNLKRPACEGCHGASVADRHHGTKNAISGNCGSCHSVNSKAEDMGVDLKKECFDCHKVNPHHKTKAAQDKKCKECHDTSGVSAYNTQVPTYKATKITPTTHTCEKCHRTGEIDGVKAYNSKDTHHGIQIQDCNLCHEENKSSINIRNCERCHDVKALHSVPDHIKKENCMHCHDQEEGASYTK